MGYIRLSASVFRGSDVAVERCLGRNADISSSQTKSWPLKPTLKPKLKLKNFSCITTGVAFTLKPNG